MITMKLIEIVFRNKKWAVFGISCTESFAIRQLNHPFIIRGFYL
jgi:hypothetical protein